MPEDEEYTDDTGQAPASLDIFGESPDSSTEDSSDTVENLEPDTDDTDAQEEDAPEGKTDKDTEPSPTESKLLGGRFKSVEDLEKSYREAEKRLASMGTELGKLRQLAENTGNESQYLFENLDTLKWQQDDTGSEEVFAKRGKHAYCRDPEGNIYVLKVGADGTGEWFDKDNVPYWTEHQWDLAEEQITASLEDSFTDEDGEIDSRGLAKAVAKEVGRLRAAKERERLQALATVTEKKAQEQKENENAEADEEAYKEEVESYKDTLLKKKFAGVEGAEEVFAPYFEEVEALLKQVSDKKIRYQPGAFKATLSLVLAAKLTDEESEEIPDIFGIKAGRTKAAPKQAPKRVVITENGRGSGGAREPKESATPKLMEY